MAQNTTVNLAAATWTQLTNSNVTSITFQNISTNSILVVATVGATPPSNLVGAIRYNPGQGERNSLLTDLFPGVTGANRVYAYSEAGASAVVSHA